MIGFVALVDLRGRLGWGVETEGGWSASLSWNKLALLSSLLPRVYSLSPIEIT